MLITQKTITIRTKAHPDGVKVELKVSTKTTSWCDAEDTRLHHVYMTATKYGQKINEHVLGHNMGDAAKDQLLKEIVCKIDAT